MLQKTNVDGYVKDIANNVVINNSTSEYQTYLMNKTRALQMQELKADINILKEEMKQIKVAIQKIMAERNV